MILKNARIYSNEELKLGSIYISNGKFNKIIFYLQKDKAYFEDIIDDDVIDCEKKILLPGIIDVHSHLRDLGQSEKETFTTGTRAAIASGITTVFNMPNTIPPAITSQNVKNWMDTARTNTYVDIGFIAGVPKNLNQEEFENISNLDVIGFKIYPHSPLSKIDWLKPKNIEKILFLASKYEVPLFIHPEMPIKFSETQNKFKNYAIKNDAPLKIFDETHSSDNEKDFIIHFQKHYERFIINNRKISTYPHIHFCHVSSKEALYVILNARFETSLLNFTFEITPHHLLLNKNMKFELDSYGKVLPPLRKEIDRNFIYLNLKKGKIDMIATDHAPHTIEEKSKPFIDAPSGFPGFETYSVLLLEKVFNSDIPLKNFIKCSSEIPAKSFGLNNKGFIKEGYDADFYLVEITKPYTVDPAIFHTKAKFSPFKGFKTTVKISEVFLRGEKIFDGKQVLDKKIGKIIGKKKEINNKKTINLSDKNGS